MRTGRASQTAIQVGRLVVAVAQHERYAAVLPDGCGEWTERLMLASGTLRPWMVRLFRRRAWRRVARVGESLTSPGQVLAFGLRKAFIDAEVRGALDAGARQVLVVGAGLDVLCARLAPRYPDVTFYEVDHPATQPLKAQALQDTDGLAPNLRLVAADLAKRPLAEVLDEAGWDPAVASVAVAEGLLMYLPEEAVRGLFSALASRMAPPSRVAFTWLPLDEAGGIELGRTTGPSALALAALGEPVRWGAHPDALAALLVEAGWRLSEDPARTDLRARFLDPVGLGEERHGHVERMGVAERAPR